MRGVFVLIALTSAVVAVSLSGYVTNTLVPLGNATSTMEDTGSSVFSLTSLVFDAGESIPSQFTCDGHGGNPPLAITGVPDGAKSLALIMDDPDIQQQFKDKLHIDAYAHWVLFNIPPATTDLSQGTSRGTAGVNSSGKNTYAAPCPPPQYEPSEHRYVFNLYALDTVLPLNAGASKMDVEQAMQGHIIAQTQLIGLYKRK